MNDVSDVRHRAWRSKFDHFFFSLFSLSYFQKQRCYWLTKTDNQCHCIYNKHHLKKKIIIIRTRELHSRFRDEKKIWHICKAIESPNGKRLKTITKWQCWTISHHICFEYVSSKIDKKKQWWFLQAFAHP